MADEDKEKAAKEDEEKAAKKEKKSADCLKDCQDAYEACMKTAGSDMEKAACKAAYTKCVSNC